MLPAAETAPAPWIWHDLGPLQFLPQGLSRALIDTTALCLVRDGEEVVAPADQCVHAGAPLSAGWLCGDLVVCPWHRFRYHIRTGAPERARDSRPQPTFPVRVVNGRLEVGLRIA